MDIFKYAESINWASDYLDIHTGYIYKITEGCNFDYKKIPVYDGPVCIGFALPEE